MISENFLFYSYLSIYLHAIFESLYIKEIKQHGFIETVVTVLLENRVSVMPKTEICS
jgi:hypothetical protein